MRRNEVKKEIFEILERVNSHPEANTSIAEEMLSKLEELGMAPPEVAEPVKTSVLVATPQGYVEQRSEDSKVFVRKWEDEA